MTQLKIGTHYPCSRAVNTARKHTAREHGNHFGHPLTRQASCE